MILEEQWIVGRYGSRAHNPYLIKAEFGDSEQPIPRLAHKPLYRRSD